MNPVEIDEVSPEAERFYAGAVRRIVRTLLAVGALLAPFVWWRYGWTALLGFGAGAMVSWINFAWLARGVEALAGRIVDQRSKERGGAVVLRFVLRYVLVGIVAYAIFKGSSQAFRAFLCGLCLPVAGMLGEAVFEAHAVFRRGL